MPDFDDPFLPSDPTLRPRPGGARRGGPEPTSSRAASPMLAEPEPLSAATRELLGIGLNPLVRAASALLLLTGQLRTMPAAMDVAGLRRRALDEVRRFEDQARESGVRNEIVLAARYVLCAGLDEAVLSTPWGAQSEWAQHPLLVTLHREAWGGEKFFEMLDRISPDPTRHIDLLELQYLSLALGFTGKYQLRDRGHEQLARIQQDLYRLIRSHRGPADPGLSLRWRGLEDRRNRLIRFVPWWFVGAAALAVLAVMFAVYYSRLASQSAPLQERLSRIGIEDFSAPAPAPVAPLRGPTLKKLLAPEEAARTMQVVETGNRTVVTLIGADLFGSGSATVNSVYEVTLQRVAAALNQVPGRVLIVGHTDNQRIKSLRYTDNAELSRERALSVANILTQTLTNPARLSSLGRGDTEPLAQGSDPESRARNRRVEIIHIREN
jgi:type VI secretion system protein ImpK